MIRKACVFIFTFVFLLFATNLAHADKPNEPDLWKTECIGRYQITLPSEVEIALIKLNKNKDGTSGELFNDGQVASFAHLDYYGDLYVSAQVAEIEYGQYKQVLELRNKKSKQEYLNSSDEKKQNWGKQMKPMTYNTSSLFGWDIEDRYPGLYFYLENRIFIYQPSHGNNALRKKQFNSVLNDLRPRPLYFLPKQPGVCIPYGFIADDGTAPRNIAVAMRLIDHPDVEIFFQDGAPSKEPKMAITLFLGGYVNDEKGINVDFRGYRSITMGEQKGKALFVTIERMDDTIDYGYIAYVKGDVSAATDTPAQMLFVIRTASRAKGTPVSKDELKEMTEKIMSSIKRHPEQ